MARTGRPRIPTAIHILNGNPSKRPLPTNEPQFPASQVQCPTWVDPYGRRIWREQAPAYIRIGLLTDADVLSFAGYCQAAADVRRLKADIEEHGTTNAQGGVRPEVKMLDGAWARLRAFASDFGLTPSSRSKINLPSKPVDALDALLG